MTTAVRKAYEFNLRPAMMRISISAMTTETTEASQEVIDHKRRIVLQRELIRKLAALGRVEAAEKARTELRLRLLALARVQKRTEAA